MYFKLFTRNDVIEYLTVVRTDVNLFQVIFAISQIYVYFQSSRISRLWSHEKKILVTVSDQCKILLMLVLQDSYKFAEAIWKDIKDSLSQNFWSSCSFHLRVSHISTHTHTHTHTNTSSSSSSSSCRAISLDIPDPLSPPLHIFHRFWKVIRATSRIYTELLHVGSS